MASGNDPKWGKWVTAPALDQLATEVNGAWPKRSKRSDGTIADHKHSPSSGHVPDHDDGDIVVARDVTAAGVDMRTIVRRFITDPYGRSNYVIFDGVIWDRDDDWKPRQYRGKNPHKTHGHFQVYGGKLARDARPWGIWTPDDPAVPRPGTFPGARVLMLTMPRTRGDDVRHVQRFIGPRRAGAADGIYGPQTERGVRWYQKMRGLRVDGIVGPRTWSHILGRAG